MKHKKLLALFMAAMMLCAFVGCGEKDVKPDPSPAAKIDVDLSGYIYRSIAKQIPESCGYLYVPKCEDPDVLAYVASPEGRAAILKATGTVDTKSITYSDPFTIVLLDHLWSDASKEEEEKEVCAAVQLYSNGQPTKICCFIKMADGTFKYGMDYPEAFAVMASFVNSSEDKPVVLGMGAGTCALYDGKIYGLYFFEHEPLTVKQTNLLRDFTAKEFIKIEVKQW